MVDPYDQTEPWVVNGQLAEELYPTNVQLAASTELRQVTETEFDERASAMPGVAAAPMRTGSEDP